MAAQQKNCANGLETFCGVSREHAVSESLSARTNFGGENPLHDGVDFLGGVLGGELCGGVLGGELCGGVLGEL